MKKFARLNYDNFIINGEVNERLPFYNENLYEMIPLDGTRDSIFPTYKIKEGNVLIGDQSVITSKSNVSITNGFMKFTGNNDSYIELSSNIMNFEKIEMEFYFKVTNLSSDSILFSSNDLTIKIDYENKFLYALMPNLTGRHTPKPDLSNGGFRLTKNNTIVLNQLHRLKLIKYESIVRVYFETDRVKSMVCENGFAASTSYIGRGLIGEIKEFNVTHPYKTMSTTTSISLPSSYTLICNFNVKDLNKKILFQMGNLDISQDSTIVTITNTHLSDMYSNMLRIDLDKDYLFILKFENNVATLIINDTEYGVNLIDDTFMCGNNSYFSVLSNSFKNLAIYKVPLADSIIEKICKKKFSLNKDGDILYEIDETCGHEKLRFSAGRKYHLQLTRDLNSDCGTITSNSEVEFVDGGVQSRLDNKMIKLQFANRINLSNTWDFTYKTKITSLTNNRHYDSLGEGTYWGIEDNRFVIKYINGQNTVSSYIDNLNANDLLNEWILVSINYSSNKIKLFIGTSKGIFSTSITKTISSITNNYDLFLGGQEYTIYGQAIYRDLTIINGWNVDDVYKEKYFRTKFSYYKNKLISNVSIVEQVNSL